MKCLNAANGGWAERCQIMNMRQSGFAVPLSKDTPKRKTGFTLLTKNYAMIMTNNPRAIGKNPKLDSALRAACVHDSPELIGALAELGADLHCADDNGFTPLHIAAGANKGRACAELIHPLISATPRGNCWRTNLPTGRNGVII